jgi:lipopolysaccharide export system permease protein
MRATANTELIRVKFQEYDKVFDLTSFFRVESNDSLFKDNYRMLSVRQLGYFKDSVQRKTDSLQKRITKEVLANFNFMAQYDSGKLKTNKVKPLPAKVITDIVPDSARFTTMDMALSKMNAAKSSMDVLYAEYNIQNKLLRDYSLGRHQKFALSFACFVMFLIGAPLGAIIRKGGLGTPLVFAVIFFAIFHLLNTSGEKLAKEGVLSVPVGIWLPSIVMVPMGVFLTFKAMRDSQLFNKEFYYRNFRLFRTFIGRFKKRKPIEQTAA